MTCVMPAIETVVSLNCFEVITYHYTAKGKISPAWNGQAKRGGVTRTSYLSSRPGPPLGVFGEAVYRPLFLAWSSFCFAPQVVFPKESI